LASKDTYDFDVTVCLPGVRVEAWVPLYESIKWSANNCSFELIIVGPHPPPPVLSQEPNIKYIQDYGCPSRCVQIASLASRGKLFTFVSDDGVLRPSSLEGAVKSFDTEMMVMRYTEGINREGGIHSQPDEYWSAWYHADLQKECLRGYLIAPVWMMETSRFKYLGGLDCRFEHINVCCQDLAFRIQANGGKLKLSPDFVMDCDWSSRGSCSVVDAYVENDKPLLDSICDSSKNPFENRMRIDYNNWLASPPLWPRRFAANELNNDYRY